MAKELLHGADVVAVAQELGRERVAERVRRSGLGEPCPTNGLRDGLLDDGFVEMVPVAKAGAPVRVV